MSELDDTQGSESGVPGSSPPPGGAQPGASPPPGDESPRARKKREREELKRARIEERDRRRTEREEEKRRRAEERLAHRSGGKTPPSQTESESTDDFPAASPADEAAGYASPAAAPGFDAEPTPEADAIAPPTDAAATEPAPLPADASRKAKRDAKRREREARKARAQAERQRVREERRRARSGAKAAKGGESSATDAPALSGPVSVEAADAGPPRSEPEGSAESSDAVAALAAAAAAGSAAAGAGYLAGRDDDDDPTSEEEAADRPEGPGATQDDEAEIEAASTAVEEDGDDVDDVRDVPEPDEPEDAGAELEDEESSEADPDADEITDEVEPSPEDRLQSAEQREDDALVVAQSEQAEADAERRIREVERIRHFIEASATETQIVAEAQEEQAADPDPDAGLLDNELRLSDQQIARRRQRDSELITELEGTEARIEASRERMEQAMVEARERLELIEAQAVEAEERAARAERLAELRQEEAERERHLHEMIGRINDAERQAREAEARARQAVAGVSRPLDSGTSLPEPLPPEPDPEPISRLAQSVPAQHRITRPVQPPPEPSPVSSEHAESTEGVLAGSAADRDPGKDAESSVQPDFGNEGASESADPDAAGIAGPPPGEGEERPIESGSGSINLNEATFEELRESGLSVTQTGRVLAHRERSGGFRSTDELDSIPGFPEDFLDQIKPRLTI